MTIKTDQNKQIIRHFRVDTANKGRMGVWPSVSMLIDTEKGVVRVIARSECEPFNKKKALEILRHESDEVMAREYAYGDRFQHVVDANDLQNMDIETLVYHVANLMQEHILKFHKEAYEKDRIDQVLRDEWLIHKMYEVKSTREKHRKCDEIEKSFNVVIDRENMTVQFL